MKIGLNESTARKVLDLLPAVPADQDLLELRRRLNTGLKAKTAAGVLTRDELDALIAVSRYAMTVKAGGAVDRLHEQLNAAIPKLEALLARAQG